MQSSILDRIFPPSSPLLPQHDRHTSRSPSATSSFPARTPRSSTVPGSSILRPAPLSASLTHHSDPLLPIDRVAKSLQRSIQSLLDAQSEGLLAGVTPNNGQDDISSNGSLTPTPTMSSTTTSRKSATLPIRQPPKKKITLRGARRGLSRSMHDFAVLKQEEGKILDTQIQERETALNRVECFTTKQEALQSEIASITSESGAQSASQLRTEASELDAQIRDLENKLFEMKARHRHLIDQTQQLESSVQSKLSSYNASLDLLDKDIKRFLARPPVAEPSSATIPPPMDEGTSPESFYSLNPKRRTLEMACEHWRDEREALKRRKEAIKHEQSALEDGGQVWREILTEIHTFEHHLKSQMQSLSHNLVSQHERDDGMTNVLSSMDQTMKLLKTRLQEAEEKNWKLLLCCIGAELEAFREGREILLEASGLGHPPDAESNGLLDIDQDDSPAPPSPDSPDEAFLRQPDSPPNHALELPSHDHGTGSAILSRPKAIPALAGDGTERNGIGTTTTPELRPNLPRTTTRADSRSESEDEDPGPDFLVSHTT